MFTFNEFSMWLIASECITYKNSVYYLNLFAVFFTKESKVFFLFFFLFFGLFGSYAKLNFFENVQKLKI